MSHIKRHEAAELSGQSEDTLAALVVRGELEGKVSKDGTVLSVDQDQAKLIKLIHGVISEM